MSNGTQHEPQQPRQTDPRSPPAVMSSDTPLAYYTPIAITPGTLKWFMGAIVAVIGFLAATPVAERYMMPAKDSDFQVVRQLVEIVRKEQAESRDAISRLTLAVDNLSGIVDSMRSLSPTRATGKARTQIR